MHNAPVRGAEPKNNQLADSLVESYKKAEYHASFCDGPPVVWREKKRLALWDGDFYDFDFYVVRY